MKIYKKNPKNTENGDLNLYTCKIDGKMPGNENMRFGKYQVSMEEGSGVVIREGDQRIYSGPWYDSLKAFFERISPLPPQRQEYELELAFNL